MQIFIKESLRNTSQGKEAERILRACVHCGFCTATCPTYQILGDELDSPRGRIYLIKSMLEGKEATDKTMQHLDRCLTCRACETTCPSGVEYGKLLDIGREQMEEKLTRSFPQRLFRTLILQILPFRIRFNFILRLGQSVRFLLPKSIKRMVPAYKKETQIETNINSKHKVLLLSGCVQQSLAPEINISVKKLLNHFEVKVFEIKNEQCCGAMSHHLGAGNQSLGFMRKNIDAMWPIMEKGIDAIISTASGCGVHVKDYAYLLREDKKYADKAKKISALTKDFSEYIINYDLKKITNKKNINQKITFQSPCTLQHGQKLNGVVEGILNRLGFELTYVKDPHLCCGSAGVYSLLQKNISDRLREDKLNNLLNGEPDIILTANIGCREHLKQQSPVPVRHWAEEVANLID